MNPVCMAVSLPAEFKFPDNDARDWLLREVVLPTAREHESGAGADGGSAPRC